MQLQHLLTSNSTRYLTVFPQHHLKQHSFTAIILFILWQIHNVLLLCSSTTCYLQYLLAYHVEFCFPFQGSSLLKILSLVLVSGIFLVTIGVLRKLSLPHLPLRKNYIQVNSQAPLSDFRSVPLHSVESSEVWVKIVVLARDLLLFLYALWTLPRSYLGKVESFSRQNIVLLWQFLGHTWGNWILL